jgi:hypothetical protein
MQIAWNCLWNCHLTYVCHFEWLKGFSEGSEEHEGDLRSKWPLNDPKIDGESIVETVF